jgi:hypothetical protein
MIGRPRRRRVPPPTLDDATIEIPINQTSPNRVGYHAPPWKPMSAQLLTDLHYGMKRAQVLANEASEEWTKRSNWLNAYAAQRGMDNVQRFKFRQGDVWLGDAFDTWSFFEREVRRYGEMIAGEYRMRQMMSDVEAAE